MTDSAIPTRRLPIERPNGAVEWVDVPIGEPAPYPTCNETDEPVDDRLARIYHCDRWARAAHRALKLEEAILDIDAHAAGFGEDEDRFVTGGYIISVGSLHRALGVVGHTAVKCRTCGPESHDCTGGSKKP